MTNKINKLTSLAIPATLIAYAQSACLSQENELAMIMCEINSALEVNDLLYEICFCPLEIDD